MNPARLQQQICRWHVYPDASSLFAHAADVVTRIARESVAKRGAFRIVLAGGNTPRPLYQKLRDIETNWSAWHIYFGDERCLPPTDTQRNSVMAHDAWLRHVGIPLVQIHPIPAERGASEGASEYAALLRGIEMFDLVLLGLGEDGHTASLFPAHDWGVPPDAPDVLAVHDAPRPPPERVSLSARRLSRARHVMFLVTGEAKQRAVADWRRGEIIPARAITPPDGVDVLIENRGYGLTGKTAAITGRILNQ